MRTAQPRRRTWPASRLKSLLGVRKTTATDLSLIEAGLPSVYPYKPTREDGSAENHLKDVGAEVADDGGPIRACVAIGPAEQIAVRRLHALHRELQCLHLNRGPPQNAEFSNQGERSS